MIICEHFMVIHVKERNKLFSLLLVIVAMITLTSCPCHEEVEEPSPVNPVNPEGQTFQQSVTLAARDADETVVLRDLNTAIKDIENNSEWLTVAKQTYSTGSPSLRLTASDNIKEGSSSVARNCAVTVTATSGNRVLLSVSQDGADSRTGIDDSHDIPTDQPAYSR